jgi:membrane glycosyltransferase
VDEHAAGFAPKPAEEPQQTTPATVHPVFGDLTPAGLQPLQVLAWRRMFFATASVLAYIFLAVLLFRGLGLNKHFVPAEALIFLLALVGMPWTIIGFWNAVTGFWLLHLHKDGLTQAAPFWQPAADAEPLNHKTAVLLTLRNENAARALSRLEAVRKSLDVTGQGAAFDYFVLSDTSDPVIAGEEEAACDRWREEYGMGARLTYRRREANDRFKAGNVLDFLDTMSAPYEYMLNLDADSVMDGTSIVAMVRTMDRYPKVGILQSLITGAPATNAFTRLFQFGMRHGMRSYTMGSAWWTADCGPYWGHNAIVRVAPFREHCRLPDLPGSPPLGGPVLSHDQLEAAFMRRAGFEVRVIPVEAKSYEDNPPTLLDFTKRDLRWCQGNMQYWRFLREPGLLPVSRAQVAIAIAMYIGSFAWTAAVITAAISAIAGGFTAVNGGTLATWFLLLFVMSLMPKIAGVADILMTRGGAARYGGTARLIAGALAEAVFSILIAPAITLRGVVFMIGLLFGQTATWNGQERDAYSLSWETAARGLWWPTAAGLVLFVIVAVFARGALLYSLPIWLGLMLSIPLAVLSSDPAVSNWFVRTRLCGIPEEFTPEPILTAIAAREAVPPASQTASDARPVT